jgi:hypothetical protein
MAEIPYFDEVRSLQRMGLVRRAALVAWRFAKMMAIDIYDFMYPPNNK